ncbi:hypothetical protein B398_07965 [Xylella fastidiosa 32]|nr:hypothetical protein B398_07965 [Xylella fastidiosa 32]
MDDIVFSALDQLSTWPFGDNAMSIKKAPDDQGPF